jgi:chromosome segregation ATPase
MYTTQKIPEITYFNGLTIDQLSSIDGPADAPEVQEIQEQIDELEKELPDVDALRGDLEEAEDELDEVQIQHKLGEADAEDVAEAERDVEAVQDELDDARTTKQALDRLRDRKEAALEAAQRAILERAKELYPKQMEVVREHLSDGLAELRTALKVLNAAGTDRVKVMQSAPDVPLFKNADSTEDFLRSQLGESS